MAKRQRSAETDSASLAIAQPTVLVLGAGNLGGWLGGRLQAAGATVHYVARGRHLQALQTHGLTLVDADEQATVLPAEALRLHTTLPAGLAPDLVLLTTKSADAPAAAAALNAALPEGSLVLAPQVGISAIDQAEQAAPRLRILRLVVPFDISERKPGRLQHQGTGMLQVQADARLAQWLPALAAAGLAMQPREEMLPLQWGQLIARLNESVNALSGRPLRQQLLDADYRLCTAALVSECVELLADAKIRPVAAAGPRPRRLSGLLRQPTLLFRLMGRQLLPADPQARSRMLEDLMHHHSTEVDAVHGEVVRLAARLGQLAPTNARVSQLLKAWTPRSQTTSGRAMRKFLNL